MKITMTTIGEIQCARFIYTKDKKIAKQFNIQKYRHLAKARQFALRFIYKKPDNLRYAICHEMLEVGIYVQKVRPFALRDLFNK